MMNAIKKDLEGMTREEQKDYLNDVVTHGCISGVVSSLIYYNDTVAFYHKHKEEINDLLNELLQETGLSPNELFRDWDNSDPLALDTHNQNLLAWFGYEEAARRLLDEEF